MSVLKITQFVAKLLPPLMAGYFRELVYPFKRARKDNFIVNRKSVTGSQFKSEIQDLHSYWFNIHGFFDWRNLLIAKAIQSRYQEADIIEIGANIGTETIGFADIVGAKGTVHAFEPLPNNMEELIKLKSNNKHLNIKLYPVGLSNHKGNSDFLVPPQNFSGIGKIIENPTNKDQVLQIEVHKLDEYLAKLSLVSIIFIDVEGHEPYVLEGAKETITKHRPAIVLEVSSSLLADNAMKIQTIVDFFDNKKYLCYQIGRLMLKRVKEKDLGKANYYSNWLCVPTDKEEVVKDVKWVLFKHIFLPLNKI